MCAHLPKKTTAFKVRIPPSFVRAVLKQYSCTHKCPTNTSLLISLIQQLFGHFENYDTGHYLVHWRVKALQDFCIPNGLHFVVKITYDVSFHPLHKGAYPFSTVACIQVHKTKIHPRDIHFWS